MSHSPVRRWGGEPHPSWGGGPSPRRGAPLPLPSQRGLESVEHSHIVDVSFGHHVLAHHLLVGHGYVARVARAAIVREERFACARHLILFLGCNPGGWGLNRPCRSSGLLPWSGWGWEAASAAAEATSTPWWGEELAVARSAVASATSLTTPSEICSLTGSDSSRVRPSGSRRVLKAFILLRARGIEAHTDGDPGGSISA